MKHIFKRLFFVYIFYVVILFNATGDINQTFTLAPVSIFQTDYTNIINFENEFLHNKVAAAHGRKQIFKYINQLIKSGHRYFSFDGFTGSGKTFMAQELAKELKKLGYDPIIIHGDFFAEYYEKKIFPVKRIMAMFEMFLKNPLGTDNYERKLYYEKLKKVIDELSEVKKYLAVTKMENLKIQLSFKANVLNAKDEFVNVRPYITKNSVLLFEGQYLTREFIEHKLIDSKFAYVPDIEASIKNRGEKRKDIIPLIETYFMKRFLGPQYKRYLKNTLSHYEYLIDNRNYNNPVLFFNKFHSPFNKTIIDLLTHIPIFKVAA